MDYSELERKILEVTPDMPGLREQGRAVARFAAGILCADYSRAELAAHMPGLARAPREVREAWDAAVKGFVEERAMEVFSVLMEPIEAGVPEDAADDLASPEFFASPEPALDAAAPAPAAAKPPKAPKPPKEPK